MGFWDAVTEIIDAATPWATVEAEAPADIPAEVCHHHHHHHHHHQLLYALSTRNMDGHRVCEDENEDRGEPVNTTLESLPNFVQEQRTMVGDVPWLRALFAS